MSVDVGTDSLLVDDRGSADDSRRARVLAARATKLARKASGNDNSEEARTEVVIFKRGEVRYGAELLLLRDIQESRSVTTVPSTPVWCLGVINLRGEIVPILDLGLLFGSTTADGARPSRVLVIEHDTRSLGLAADDIEESLSLAPEEIHPPLSSFHARRAQFVQGIADRDALIVDCRRLLAYDELFT